MKKPIIYMAIGGILTLAVLTTISNKMDVERCFQKMNKNTMKAYKFIRGKMGA